LNPESLPDIGVGLMSNEIKTAKLPPSLVGDFLYPGATMVSAKMKEGKSYLAMQLGLAVATQTPFLAGAKHPGFPVKHMEKVVIIAGEDTAGGIASRFMGSIASGHLPTTTRLDDVKVVFNDDLDRVRQSHSRVPALALFESLVNRWYEKGYRVIAIDPLRVLEAALAIDEYPGVTRNMNAHARDFQTMRYFTKIAQQYEDLCILVSMHHGKNKRDHDATDPGDMIAGTTGFGAGAITTISLLPIADQLGADEDEKTGFVAKRRELYLHGRYTREQRILIEQDPSTGVWQALGSVADELMGQDRQKYFEALLASGGTSKFVSAEDIAKTAGGRTKAGTVHKVLSRARRQGNTYLGWKLVIKRGVAGGYRLVENLADHGVRRRDV
jgi:RecA-family ATPase